MCPSGVHDPRALPKNFGLIFLRDGNTTIKTKFAFLRGGGGMGAERKIFQKLGEQLAAFCFPGLSVCSLSHFFPFLAFGPFSIVCQSRAIAVQMALQTKRFAFRISLAVHIQGEKKHININKFGGSSRDWMGGTFLFVYSSGVIPYVGSKYISKILPPNPRTILWKKVFILDFFRLFCLLPTHCRYRHRRKLLWRRKRRRSCSFAA